MNEYTAITVQELRKLCTKEIALGNGKKKIMISQDDEGNGYHGLFYSFCSDEDEIKTAKKYGLLHDDDVDINEIILLG